METAAATHSSTSNMALGGSPLMVATTFCSGARPLDGTTVKVGPLEARSAVPVAPVAGDDPIPAKVTAATRGRVANQGDRTNPSMSGVAAA
jgi:hypothetical protein